MPAVTLLPPQIGTGVLGGAVAAVGAQTIPVPTFFAQAQPKPRDMATRARIGSGALVGVAASSAPPSKMFLLGRVTNPYASASAPLGPDGACDQFWNGTTWAFTNVTSIANTWGIVNASGCYDPTTGLIYLFGNWDGTGTSGTFDTATGVYNPITALPSTAGGNDGFAVVNGTHCYIFGGMVSDGSLGMSSAIQSYPINKATQSQSYTTLSSVMPYAGKDMFGCTNPATGLVYFGGGNAGIQDPPVISTCFTNWMRWDPSSPNTNPVAMHAMPIGISEAACVCLNGVIYVIGGAVDQTPDTVGTHVVRTYTIATDTWGTTANYPIDVAFARATVFNGVIYCACGFDSRGFFDTDDPPSATSAVYKSSDSGASWQLHSSLVDVNVSGTPRGAKASGGSILVAI